jgi:large subunit ribosomal protein L35|mmetsp:Transcript_1956/g.5941  ORF Transcript_1956/g.5941 Transcript_1956/m.5941 type:complete len:133 (+) Transcript_1956:2018-2416(+)
MISSLLNNIALQTKPKGILDREKCGQKSLTQRGYVGSERELSFSNSKNSSSAEKYTFEVNANKTKTRKSASKRYKLTPSGKVLHRRPGKAHLNGPKSSARKYRLSHVIELGRQQLSLVRTVLPYSKLASKRK